MRIEIRRGVGLTIRPGRMFYCAALTAAACAWVGWPGLVIALAGSLDIEFAQ